MNIYIMTDMEGISLVSKWDQVKQGQSFYEKYRTILTQEINAAVEGAISAGATRIVVNDGHGSQDYNVMWELLHPIVELERPDSAADICPSLDESFHAVLHIGAHAREGTPNAIMPHTQNHETWLTYEVNGQVYGEIGQLAIVAGYSGVPVAYISGDAAAVAEAKELLGDALPATIVKWGHAAGAATCLHPEESMRRIRADVDKALRDILTKPYRLEGRLEVKVTYKSTKDAMKAAEKPGAELLDPFTVRRMVDNAKRAVDI
ncbi:M55 family metallopeptidase [Paenibacillus nasutitermitis]|uniref:M55 family metallopeptidase n=1 Tax=Paenibacillus nasutitermitis TaxID=1652958 RepID=UPI001E383B75|nr:M55 family metallopeptidase [Paenibacillus nasutitermitis]